jgi:hypothetical protein
MVQFWKKLRLFRGFGLLIARTQAAQTLALKALAAPEQAMPVQATPVQAVPTAPWVLGFGSVLPGMRMRVALPVGPGRTLTVGGHEPVTVIDIWNKFEQLAQSQQNWPFGQEAETFAGQLSLEGPDWSMEVLFSRPGPFVEFYAAKADGAVRAAGQVRWEAVAQATLLCPDYDAVTDYLRLSPYHLWGYEV